MQQALGCKGVEEMHRKSGTHEREEANERERTLSLDTIQTQCKKYTMSTNTTTLLDTSRSLAPTYGISRFTLVNHVDQLKIRHVSAKYRQHVSMFNSMVTDHTLFVF